MPAKLNFLSEEMNPTEVSYRWPGDSKRNRIESSRLAFMSDPNKVEQIVAHLSKAHVPDSKATKMTMNPTLAKVEEAIPEDDPRRGLGTQVMAEANIAMAAMPNKHPLEIIKSVYDKNYSDRLRATYEYMDKKQKPFLGIPFTGKSIGKDIANAPGYEEYRAQKEEYNKSHFTFDDYSSPQAAAVQGAGLAGIGMAAAKYASTGAKGARIAGTVARFLPSIAKGIPNPLVRLGITALASIPEFWAFETAHQAITKAPGVRDMPELPKQIAGMVGGGFAMSKVSKSLTKGIESYMGRKAATEALIPEIMDSPTVENIVKYGTSKSLADRSLLALQGQGPAKVYRDGKIVEPSGNTGAAATPGGIANLSGVDQADRIVERVYKGKDIATAAGEVITEDRLLKTLNRIKAKKFYDTLVQDKNEFQARSTAIRSFREGIAEGLTPGEAALRAQKTIGEENFNNVIALSGSKSRQVFHSPEESAVLRNLGYSDEVIGGIPASTVKNLVTKMQTKAKAAEQGIASTDSKLSDVLHAKDLVKMTPAESTSYYPYGAEIIEARSAVAKNAELIAEKSKVAPSVKMTKVPKEKPVHYFVKGEPAADAPEEEWYKFFSSESMKKSGLPDGKYTIDKIPPAAIKAYDKAYNERLDAIHAEHLKKVEKSADDIAVIKKKIVNEPIEDIKALNDIDMGDVPDVSEEAVEAYKTLKLTEAVNAKQARLATLRGEMTKMYGGEVPVYKGEKKVSQELGDVVENVSAVKTKVKKEKKTFNDESVDLFTRYSRGSISQDEYDSALDAMMQTHEYGGADKEWGKMLSIAIGAGSLATLASLVPTNVDAAGLPPGVVTKFTESIAKGLTKSYDDMIKLIVDNKYFVPEYVKGSYDFGEFGRSISIVPSINNVTRKAKLFGQDYISPNVVADVLYNTTDLKGRKIFTNPMTELAHRTSVAMGHTAKGLSMLDDIMKAVPGGESHAKEIEEAFKPLLGDEKIARKLSFHRGNIKSLDDMIAGIAKKQKKVTNPEELAAMDNQIVNIMEQQELSRQAMAELKFDGEKFDAQWDVIARDVAKKYPSSRIALALDGQGLDAADPWVLQYMSEAEKQAVGHIHRLHNKIADRLIDVGGEPILSKSYIHHANHPGVDFKELQKELEGFSLNGNDIIPLSKLFHRQYNSKLMMPDVQYIEQKYFPDIFKRIEMMDFWKKGRTDGWAAHANAVTRLGWRGPADFMAALKRSFAPEETTTLNDFARKAYAFEAARLIGMNPAPGFKHIMKQLANIGNFGPTSYLTNLPKQVSLFSKDTAARAAQAIGQPMTKDLETDVYRFMTNAGNMSAIMQDLSLYDAPKGWFETIGRKATEYGGMAITLSERFDRAASFIGAATMAGKQGMTAEQAVYSIYDTVLKANFLSGNQNPAWLRNPKIRALFMFQGTPFKIAEQRALLAWKGGKAGWKAAKETWSQLQGLKAFVKEGEAEFKFNMIKDALESEKDVFGIPYAYQLMRQALTIGTVIVGGAKLFDADLIGHTLHLPFVKKEEGLKINVNPFLNAALSAKGSEDEFWTSSFMKKWFNSGPMPTAVSKAIRLSKDDIPKIYRDSHLRYFFGVPATHE